MYFGDYMKDIDKYIIIFLIGGIGYGIIEVLFRGYTHWSMIITGGAAFLSLYIINNALTNTSIFIKALLGMIVITVLEFSVGIIVNKILALDVWDYTNMPGNILGQISLQFSACWYGLSVVAFIIFENIHIVTDLQKS